MWNHEFAPAGGVVAGGIAVGVAGGVAVGAVGEVVGGVVGGVVGAAAPLPVAAPLFVFGFTRILLAGFLVPLAAPAAAGVCAPLTSALISGGKSKIAGSIDL